jgi:hypothetical protein
MMRFHYVNLKVDSRVCILQVCCSVMAFFPNWFIVLVLEFRERHASVVQLC